MCIQCIEFHIIPCKVLFIVFHIPCIGVSLKSSYHTTSVYEDKTQKTTTMWEPHILKLPHYFTNLIRIYFILSKVLYFRSMNLPFPFIRIVSKCSLSFILQTLCSIAPNQFVFQYQLPMDHWYWTVWFSKGFWQRFISLHLHPSHIGHCPLSEGYLIQYFEV